MKIGNKEFEIGSHTYVMGILNVTPDSFSDGGNYDRLDRALFRVEEMQKEGMDILDIGGESTRPGYEKISEEEEIERILPVIEAVKKRFQIPISLDTYKKSVAEAGIKAGADLINDIWGLQYEKEMAVLLAKEKIPCVLMHNRKDMTYTDFLQDVLTDLQRSLAIADQAGILRSNIILDPGVGFAKTYEQNLQIIRDLEVLQELGCPLLLGSSRKSLIGLTLDLPADQRVEGTLVTTVYAVWKGCSFVRVHDIKENVRAIKMAEALKNC